MNFTIYDCYIALDKQLLIIWVKDFWYEWTTTIKNPLQITPINMNQIIKKNPERNSEEK